MKVKKKHHGNTEIYDCGLTKIENFNLQFDSNPGDLGDLHDDDHGEVNSTRTFDWLTIGHKDGILGRSLAVCINR